MEPRDTYATENSSFGNNKSWVQKNMGWLIGLGILLLVVIGLFIWKTVEANRYEERISAMEVYYNTELDSIIAMENKEYLRKVMKPFVWAVRSEMIRDNLEQVQDYMRQFVQDENMQAELVLVVNEQGRIIASTDQKLEGQQYSGEIASALLSVNDITVRNYEEGKLIGAAPIVSFSAKTGTLIVVYKPNEYTLEYSGQ